MSQFAENAGCDATSIISTCVLHVIMWQLGKQLILVILVSKTASYTATLMRKSYIMLALSNSIRIYYWLSPAWLLLILTCIFSPGAFPLKMFVKISWVITYFPWSCIYMYRIPYKTNSEYKSSNSPIPLFYFNSVL